MDTPTINFTVPKIPIDIANSKSMVYEWDKEEFKKDRVISPHYSILEILSSELLFEMLSHLEWYELLKISQTCTTLRDISQSEYLWHKMKNLDFLAIKELPLEKIQEVVLRCPNAESLLLGEEATDHLLLEILHSCPKLKSFILISQKITNTFVEAVASECRDVHTFCLKKASRVQKEAISNLLTLQKNLTTLELSECTGVSDLDVKVQNNESFLKLKQLKINGSSFREENFETLARNCPWLEELDLSDCYHLHQLFLASPPAGVLFHSLKTLSLMGCFDLNSIRIVDDNGSLEVLDVRGCKQLNDLTLCSENMHTLLVTECSHLKSLAIASSRLQALDCSNLVELKKIELDCTKLTSLDLSDCISFDLEQLSQQKGIVNLEKISFKGCKQFDFSALEKVFLPKLNRPLKLTFGDFAFSQLDLKVDIINSIFIQNVPTLTGVTVNSLSLETLVFESCKDLNEQELVDGIILGRKVKRFPGLITKEERERVKDETFIGAKSLKCLSLSNIKTLQGNILSEQGHRLQCLKHINFYNCKFLRVIEFKSWPMLKTISAESCQKLLTFVVKDCPNLQSINIKWCSMINKFEVHCNKLVSLSVTGCGFEEFSLFSPILAKLEVSEIISKIPNIQCPLLEHLSLIRCENIPQSYLSLLLSSLPQLKYLQIISNNQIRHIVCTKSIVDLSLVSMRRLEKVQLGNGCHLSKLQLYNLPKLGADQRQSLLDTNKGSLKQLVIKALPRVTQFKVQLDRLTSLTLDQCIHLTELEIGCPCLSYLRLQGCPRLTDLLLKVDELPQLQVDHSSPLLSLRSLKLYCCNIRFLARVLGFYCPNLYYLYISEDDSISLGHIKSVGHTLPDLETIVLQNCFVGMEVDNDDDDNNDGQPLEILSNDFELTAEQLQRLNEKKLHVLFH